jgi:hypothetical protein
MSELPNEAGMTERVENAIKHLESIGMDGPWHITFHPGDDVDAMDILSDITFHYDPLMPRGRVLVEPEFGYLQRMKGSV